VIDIVFIHRRVLKRRAVRDYICTYVRGDSMEPVLRDGDAVIGRVVGVWQTLA
jgi:phage repressor protein C with HTH and peptisase S24 domain